MRLELVREVDRDEKMWKFFFNNCFAYKYFRRFTRIIGSDGSYVSY